jgi:hypothetical protein
MSQLATIRLCDKCAPHGIEQFGKAGGVDTCQGCLEKRQLNNIHLHSLLLSAHNPETEHGAAALVALAGMGFRHNGRRCSSCNGYHLQKLPTVGPPWRGVLQSPEEYSVYYGVSLQEARTSFTCPAGVTIEELTPDEEPKALFEVEKSHLEQGAALLWDVLSAQHNGDELDDDEALWFKIESARKHTLSPDRQTRALLVPTGNYAKARLDAYLNGDIELQALLADPRGPEPIPDTERNT